MKKTLVFNILLAIFNISIALILITATASTFNKTEHQRYTVSHCRYYTDGTVITSDGMLWSYRSDSISGELSYDGMPVVMALDDNGTPSLIEDDIVLGLVYDRETAIYDELETKLSGAFNIEREDNNIRIQSLK